MRVCIISHEASAWAGMTSLIKKGKVEQVCCYSCLEDINFSDIDIIVFVGFVMTTVVRELQLPAESRMRDLPGSVEYQFVRQLPFDTTESPYWEFIPLPRKSKVEPYPIRAAAVSVCEHQKQMELLNQRGVKIDQFFLTPLLFCDQFFPGSDKYAPPQKQEIVNYFSTEQVPGFENFSRECAQNQIVDSILQINLFVARQFLCASNGKTNLYMSSGMLPENLRPSRCHTLKRINFTLCGILLLCIGIQAYRHINHSWQTYSQLKKQNKVLQQQVRQLQQETLRVNQEIELLKHYYEVNPGHPDLRPVLREVSQKIPSYMWVESLRFANGVLELSVKSEKDDINFYKNLKEASRYKLVNLRKNRAMQGKTEYSVTLKVEDVL